MHILNIDINSAEAKQR